MEALKYSLNCFQYFVYEPRQIAQVIIRLTYKWRSKI
jgi:hypothetical protein